MVLQQENNEKQKKSDIAKAEQKQQRKMEIIKSSALGKVPVMDSTMELASTATSKNSAPGTEKKTQRRIRCSRPASVTCLNTGQENWPLI